MVTTSEITGTCVGVTARQGLRLKHLLQRLPAHSVGAGNRSVIIESGDNGEEVNAGGVSMAKGGPEELAVASALTLEGGRTSWYSHT